VAVASGAFRPGAAHSLLRGRVGDSGGIYAGVDAGTCGNAAVATLFSLAILGRDRNGSPTGIPLLPTVFAGCLRPTVVNAVDDHVGIL